MFLKNTLGVELETWMMERIQRVPHGIVDAKQLNTTSLSRTMFSINVAEGRQYDHVALGGTFDHLHAGHRILLTAPTLIASHRIFNGITGYSLSLSSISYSIYS